MKISLQWLADHLDLRDRPISEISDLLTFAGIEVEGITSMPDHLVVARIDQSEPHPNADKLSVCQVDDGSGKLRQIVCGAKNYRVGDHVPLALPGCDLGNGFVIKDGKLRGVPSRGMLCSAVEIGLAAAAEGLLILPAHLAPGTPMSEVFPPVLTIEITPNRPDLLSHLGLARELAALLKTPLKQASTHAKSATPKRSAAPDEIRIEAPESCPLYTGRILRGIKVAPSPTWLQERLTAVGLRPINNIVDITNYVLMEMGQPLHAFDLAKLDGGIRVRLAAAGESFQALDGKTYALAADDCVIADSRRPQAIAGVMGGELSGVTEQTTAILLEAAYFTPSHVRRTSHRLGLHSDSSYRFERGVDPAQVIGASDLAVKLIRELAGGTPDDEIRIAGQPPVLTGKVKLDPQHCRNLIGYPLEDAEIGDILSRLGLKAGKTGWQIPSYRQDLQRPVDLIEEVARVIGLARVPSSKTAEFTPPSAADQAYDFQQQVRQHLVHLGFSECQTIKLISEGQLADDLVSTRENASPLKVMNPMTDTHSFLRPSLIPSLLRVADHNLRMGAETLRLFEMGTVFAQDVSSGDASEAPHLALLLTGPACEPSWRSVSSRPLDFHDLRGILEAVAGQPLRFSPVADPRVALAADVVCGKTRIGRAGQLLPARARQLDLKQPVLVAEISLADLAAARSENPRFADWPRFPAMTRDVAIEAPADLTNQQIADFFRSAVQREPLLESFRLFDVFADPTGQKLAADRRSLAYSLTYRDAKGSLEAATIDALHARILEDLKKRLPVSFR